MLIVNVYLRRRDSGGMKSAKKGTNSPIHGFQAPGDQKGSEPCKVVLDFGSYYLGFGTLLGEEMRTLGRLDF